MTTHTPTPWRVYDHMPNCIEDAMGNDVFAQAMNKGSERNEANAAFIVQACNAHDALVAALRDVLSQYLLFVNVNSDEIASAVVAQARAALALAGKE